MDKDKGENSKPLMEINTTPLIDVMLVLLIMFVITLPPGTHAVKIDTPAPDEGAAPEFRLKNRVAVTADGTVTWNDRAVDLTTLRRHLDQTVRMKPQPELQFRPDAEARYARVDQTLAVIKRSGVTRMGFVGNENYSAAF